MAHALRRIPSGSCLTEEETSGAQGRQHRQPLLRQARLRRMRAVIEGAGNEQTSAEMKAMQLEAEARAACVLPPPASPVPSCRWAVGGYSPSYRPPKALLVHPYCPAPLPNAKPYRPPSAAESPQAPPPLVPSRSSTLLVPALAQLTVHALGTASAHSAPGTGTRPGGRPGRRERHGLLRQGPDRRSRSVRT